MADDKAPKTIDIPIPQKLQKMIGLPYSSHTMWSGIDPAEYNRDFANFRTAIATYEKMVRSDSQCQSVWNVIKLWLDSLTYRVDPPKEPTPEETRLRDLCERGLYQQPNASGDDLIHELTMGILWSWAIVEMQVEWVDEEQAFLPIGSEMRYPGSINDFITDDRGNVLSLVQDTWNFRATVKDPIPRQNCIIYTHGKVGNALVGVGFQRASHRNWKMKYHELNCQAVAIERASTIIPKIKVPSHLYNEKKAEYENLGRSVRVSKQGFLLHTDDCEIDVLDTKVSGTALKEIGPAVDAHDRAIATNALVQFLIFGGGSTSGAQNVYETFVEAFIRAVLSHGRSIGKSIKRDMFEGIKRWNGFAEDVRTPDCKPIGLDDPTLQELINALNVLLSHKVLKFYDEDEKMFRDKLGMITPSKDAIEVVPEWDLGGDPKDSPDKLIDPKQPKQPNDTATVQAEALARAPRPTAQATAPQVDVLAQAVADSTTSQHERMAAQVAQAEVRGIKADAERKLLALSTDFQKIAIDDIVAQVAERQGKGLDSLNDVGVSDELIKAHTARLTPVLDNVKRAGARHVVEELADQAEANGDPELAVAIRGNSRATAVFSEEDYTGDGWQDFADYTVGRSLTRVADGLANVAKDDAPDFQRTGEFDEEGLRLSLEEKVLVVAAVAFGYLSSAAYNAGRHSAAVANSEYIEKAIYSSVLEDKITCTECVAANGTVTTVGSPLYESLMPPNRRCHGKNRCLCIWLYEIINRAPGGPEDEP